MLIEQLAAPPRVDAMVSHLFGIPTYVKTDQQSAFGDIVNAGDFLCRLNVSR
ncbi:hypothetical protein [Mycobacterium sp. URHB0021]